MTADGPDVTLNPVERDVILEALAEPSTGEERDAARQVLRSAITRAEDDATYGSRGR